jgi:hypothetical protein
LLVDGGLFHEAHWRDDGALDEEGSGWWERKLPAMANLGLHHLLKRGGALFGALVVSPHQYGVEIGEAVVLGESGAPERRAQGQPFGGMGPEQVAEAEWAENG